MPKVTRSPKFRASALGSSKRTPASLAPVSSTPLDSNGTVTISKNQECDAEANYPSAAAKKTADHAAVASAAQPSKSRPTEAAGKIPPIEAIAAPPVSQAALSRGQRKRQAKRDQYLRRERLVLLSLKLQREEEQRKRIDGLDAIRNALLATVQESTAKTDTSDKAQAASSGMLKSNKARQTLVQKEAAQMSLVLQHPAFVSDPFGAIREHLTNTLTRDVEKQKAEAAQHVKDVARKEEERKARKREHSIKRKRHKVKAARSKAR